MSRYYDPVVGRFLNADALAVITATPGGLTDKNLFSYCDNNPVVRIDCGGQFWDTVFDVITVAISIAEVCSDPTDVGAWIGLAADTVDLIPFVTGVGETIRAIRVVKRAEDIYDAAKIVNKTDDFYDAVKNGERLFNISK